MTSLFDRLASELTRSGATPPERAGIAGRILNEAGVGAATVDAFARAFSEDDLGALIERLETLLGEQP